MDDGACRFPRAKYVDTARSHRLGSLSTIENPNIDFAKLASSMGVWSEGPITDAAKLDGAFSRALAAVKRGEPALVDVVCQGR